MSLTKDDILGAKDGQVETVKVPEWGGNVFIRVMTGQQRDSLEASFADTNGTMQSRLHNLRSRLAALTLCDQDGTLLFTEKDVDTLAQKSSLALNRIFEAAQKLNQISAEAVEDLVGN